MAAPWTCALGNLYLGTLQLFINLNQKGSVVSVPQAGDTAPDFTLPADNGETVTLSQLRGTPVVVYFYPKDDTPGCTTEAKDFTAQADAFRAAGITVLGISPDSVEKHVKFKTKRELDVTLLADEDQSAAGAFGVWVEKQMYGKTYMGVERSTFLIDADGVIVEAWRKVKVPGHVDAVLERAKAVAG